MDDVYLGGWSALKENAVASTFAPQRSKSEIAAFESTRTSVNELSFLVDHARGQAYRTMQNYGNRRRMGSLPDIYKRSERNSERQARAFHRKHELSNIDSQPAGLFDKRNRHKQREHTQL